MKKLLLILPLLLLISFANCKKAKGPASVPSIQPNNGADSLFNMRVLINGVDWWETDSAYSYKVKQSGNDSGLISLMIQATHISADTAIKTSTIVFNINNYTGPGTYNFNPPVTSIIYYEGTVRHPALNGQIIVVSDTGQLLRGTFLFDAYRDATPNSKPIPFRNGTFSVALP